MSLAATQHDQRDWGGTGLESSGVYTLHRQFRVSIVWSTGLLADLCFNGRSIDCQTPMSDRNSTSLLGLDNVTSGTASSFVIKVFWFCAVFGGQA